MAGCSGAIRWGGGIPRRGGELYRKRLDAGPIWTIHVGSRAAVTRYMRRYLVWNWHFGGTDRVLLPVNGDTLDDRIDNIRLGARLEGFTADAPLAGAVPAAETGVTCPCCGAVAPVLSPNLLARAYQLPPQQEAILTRVWQGKGKPVTGEAIIGEMYADDFDGGPEYETARKYFKTQLCLPPPAHRGIGRQDRGGRLSARLQAGAGGRRQTGGGSCFGRNEGGLIRAADAEACRLAAGPGAGLGDRGAVRGAGPGWLPITSEPLSRSWGAPCLATGVAPRLVHAKAGTTRWAPPFGVFRGKKELYSPILNNRKGCRKYSPHSFFDIFSRDAAGLYTGY